MALQDIILRSSSHAPLTTKGSELTYTELDGNFIEIYDAVASINDISNIAPFNITTTYSGTEYVSYNGNIYVHISATDTTGILPDTDPTKWQLTSIGALAHQQNKDSYLAFGSASQVSATDLANIINYQVINVTYSAFMNLVNTSTLKVNRLYCITDTNAHLDNSNYVNSSIKLYIRTISTNQYSNRGFISFVAPKYDTFSVYDYTNAYVINDKVGYGLFVYQCIDATANGDTPNNDVASWQLKSPISFPAYYSTRFYDVDFIDNNGIFYFGKLYDKNNNTFGSTDFENGNIVSTQVNYNNDIDTSSYWNNMFGNANGVYSNKLVSGSFINSKGGYSPNSIGSNYLVKSAITCDEFFNGDIFNNQLQNVTLNIPNGDFLGTLANLKISFAVNTSLNVDANTSINGGYMNEQGSNIAVNLDITGTSGVVELDSILNYADIYGVFEMDCSGQMIDYLLKGNYYCPIVIKPATAHQSLTIKIYDLSSANNNNCVSSNYGSGTYDLYTDNGDYAVLEKVNINGFDLWNVTYINKIN